MAHSLACRRGHAGDEAHHWFFMLSRIPVLVSSTRVQMIRRREIDPLIDQSAVGSDQAEPLQSQP
jgi:hypothetical protein